MTTASTIPLDPQMAAAIAELTEAIRKSYPETTFVVDAEENQEAVFVTAIVDVDDPDEVVDCFIDRVLTLQIEEGLPLHIIPIRTAARRERLRATLQVEGRRDKQPRSAVG
ncbi:MAG: hypothetical protein KF883_00755 [Thermomicrobiales bacterium]|nr:hypothetical protein [Thermomicrobiales bacterium]